MKTKNGLALANIKTINGLAIGSVKTVNGVVVADSSRYWVGGTGNTSDTAHWSLTSNGAGGASVPTLSDNAIWDVNSGAGTSTLNAVFACKSFTATGYTGTIAFSSTSDCYGSITLGAGMGYSGTSAITLRGTGTHTITTAGKSITNQYTLNTTGGSYTLQDNFVSSSSILVTAGSFYSGGYSINNTAVTAGNGSLTRYIDLQNSTYTTSGTTLWGGSNLTANTTGCNIVATSNASITISAVSSLTFASYTNTANGSPTFSCVNATFTGDFIRTTASGYLGTVVRGNIAVGGNLTVSGTSNAAGRHYLRTGIPGVPAVFTVAGTVTLTNVDFEDITAVGAAWTGTSLGDCGGNTNITTDAPRTCYLVEDGTASMNYFGDYWKTTSGGATPTAFPLPQDMAIVDVNSILAGGRTITTNSARIGSIDFTGVLNSPTFTVTAQTSFYDDITFVPTLGGTIGAVEFRGRNTPIIISAGKTWGGAVTCRGLGTLFKAGDAFTMAAGVNLTLVSGTIDSDVYTMTLNAFNATGSGTTAIGITGSGTWVVGSAGSTFDVSASSNLTVGGTITIKATNATSSVKTVSFGNYTYYKFWNATTSTGVVRFVGSPTFTSEVKSDVARTMEFTAASTITSAAFNITGSIGNVNTITAVSAAGQYTFVKTGGGVVALTYMNIAYCIGSPIATFAATLSTDSGNNTNWTITP